MAMFGKNMPFYQADRALSSAIYALHPLNRTNNVSPQAMKCNSYNFRYLVVVPLSNVSRSKKFKVLVAQQSFHTLLVGKHKTDIYCSTSKWAFDYSGSKLGGILVMK